MAAFGFFLMSQREDEKVCCMLSSIFNLLNQHVKNSASSCILHENLVIQRFCVMFSCNALQSNVDHYVDGIIMSVIMLLSLFVLHLKFCRQTSFRVQNHKRNRRKIRKRKTGSAPSHSLWLSRILYSRKRRCPW